MFNKLKTTTLAAITGTATLLGSGQAWALDQVNFQSPPLLIVDSLVQGWAGPQECDVTVVLSGGAEVVISPFGQQPFATGRFLNNAWDPNRIPSPDADVIARINECIVLSGYPAGSSITNFARSAGGPGTDYFQLDWLGISFEFNGITYEYGLRGQQNTQIVWSAQIPPPPSDTTSPSVTLSGGPASITGTDPFTVTATFDEDVTGFDDLANDVTITNGTVTAIIGGPSAYTLTVTPTGSGDVEITVPAAAAQDAASNPNTASEPLVIGNRIVEITQEQIAGFMLGRANNLASNQPGLTRFLMGEGCGAFNANANEAAGSINGCVAEGNFWADIAGSWSGDGSYTLGTIGAHGFVNPDLLIGGMVQFDHMDDPANNASGRGWMIGPYFVARVPEQPLYFEGRLLYGQTDNDITPIGTYTDSFETERWLAQLRATGEYLVQSTTLMPLLDVTYTEDSQRAYTDSLGNTIPGQTISLMQLNAGLDFSQPLPVQSGTLTLTGGLSGIFSATDGGAVAPEFENWRGRTHLGLNYDTGAGATMNVGAFYDGIGTGYESHGAQAGFDWRF